MLSKEVIEKLKSLPRPRCFRCRSVRSYTNPLAICFECKQKFCFDHIFGGQVNAIMERNEEVRDICDNCKEKFGYINVS